MAGFSKEKEALLQRSLSKFDADIQVEDVISVKESEESNHTFVIQVLLEVICTLLEKEAGKRQQLFNAGYKFLTEEKILNANISLGSFLPLRQKFALQMYQQMNQIQKSLSTIPHQDMKYIDFIGMSSFSKKFQDDFIEIAPIGKGGFGTVCKAKHKIDGIVYAVKKIPFVYRQDGDYAKVIREVKSIATLNHINVVGYNNAWVEPDDETEVPPDESTSALDNNALCRLKVRREELRYSSTVQMSSRRTNTGLDDFSDDILFLDSKDSAVKSHPKTSRMFADGDSSESSDGYSESSLSSSEDELSSERSSMFNHWGATRVNLKASLFIQMEFCYCSLRTWLKKRIKGSELPFHKTEAEIFREILSGVAHIHSKSIIHRDLKPQNIFYSRQSDVLKIGDFGLSTMSGQSCLESLRCTPDRHSCDLGTLPYAAPEQRRRGDYDSKVDMYSLGIILIEILLRIETVMELDIVITNIADRNILPDELLEKWPEYVSLVKNLVQSDPRERMSSKDVLNSPFMQDHQEERLRDSLQDLRVELSCRSKERDELLERIVEQDRTIVELNDRIRRMESRFEEQERLLETLRKQLESS